MTSPWNAPKLSPPEGFRGQVELESLSLGGAAGDAWLFAVDASGVFGSIDRAYETFFVVGFDRRRYGATSIDDTPGHCRQEQHDWRFALAVPLSGHWTDGSTSNARLGAFARLGYRYRAETWGWEWTFTGGYSWNLHAVSGCDGTCRVETLSLRWGLFTKPYFAAAESRVSLRPLITWGPPELTFYELTAIVTFGVETDF